jgi:predicted P-loop ATPase
MLLSDRLLDNAMACDWNSALVTLNARESKRDYITDQLASKGLDLSSFQWGLLALEDEAQAVYHLKDEFGLHSSKGDSLETQKNLDKLAFKDCEKIFAAMPDLLDLAFCKGHYWIKYLKGHRKHAHDTAIISRVYGEKLRYNLLRLIPEVDGEEIKIDDIRSEIENNYRETMITCKDDAISNFIGVAKRRSYNPVIEYLESCAGSNVAINADIILTHCLGISVEKVGTQVFTLWSEYIKRFLIGAVARAYNPGCTLRTVLVLKGSQYIGKSKFFGVLGGEWFDDSISMNSEKDDKMKMNRTWFCEWQELEQITGKKEAGAVKSWISSSRDSIRPPYARSVVDMPRPSVLCATVNEDSFLVDTTGNSRYWVVDLSTAFVDLAWLKTNRDAVWAYAVSLYKSGAVWWFDDKSESDMAMFKLQNAMNEQFATSDPWEDKIENLLPGLHKVTVSNIMQNLDIDTDKQNIAVKKRIERIMRTLGWQPDGKQVMEDGERFRYWRPGKGQDDFEAIDPGTF